MRTTIYAHIVWCMIFNIFFQGLFFLLMTITSQDTLQTLICHADIVSLCELLDSLFFFAGVIFSL